MKTWIFFYLFTCCLLCPCCETNADKNRLSDDSLSRIAAEDSIDHLKHMADSTLGAEMKRTADSAAAARRASDSTDLVEYKKNHWKDVLDSISNARRISDADLPGYVLKNTEDSTLLKVMYGNFLLTDTIYHFTGNYDTAESFVSRFYDAAYSGNITDFRIMEEDTFGPGGNAMVIFMGADVASQSMHILTLESALICVKEPKGWRVKDFYRDKERIDFRGREVVFKDNDGIAFQVYTRETEFSEASTEGEEIKNFRFEKTNE
ncbi:MAG TPA: hypothetical protein VL651_11955 [Bacteroidia bacterium]|jgi:hypothetical protein|nr:hypothetical protein [Bacteroidia bacterium]